MVLPPELSQDWFYWIGHINADKAWDISTGTASAAAKIGIVDTGINLGQAVLDNARLERFDGSGNDLSGVEDDSKDAEKDYHGRWVTGFAAGYRDSSTSQARGVAWQNRVVMVDIGKAQTGCTVNVSGLSLFCKKDIHLTDLHGGVKTALQHGAKVLNISLGAAGIACQDDPETADVNEADHNTRVGALAAFRSYSTPLVELAQQHDALIVFSAGNECEKADDQFLLPGTRMPAEPWKTNALRVAATDVNRQGADFSNFGLAVDLAAPGSQVGFYGGDGFVDSLESSLQLTADSGTSFAAPQVTGTAALVRGAREDLAAPEVRYLVLDSAQKLPIALKPNLLLDAYKAVSAASGIQVPMETLSPLSLTEGETKQVNVAVTLASTTVRSMDIVFLIDTTGSFYDDIDALQANAESLIDNLTSRGIDVQFGVASFADFPFAPYGNSSAGDKAFYLNQAITSDITAVKAGIQSLDQPLHDGYDEPESQLTALYQAATGAGLDLNGDGRYTSPGELMPANIGWRPGSLKVIVLATDATFHTTALNPNYPCAGCPPVSFDATINALRTRGITVEGIGTSSSLADVTRITSATGGDYYTLSAGIAATIAQAITDKLAKVTLSPQAIANGEWISSVDPPSYIEVQPGDTRNFTLTLVGLKKSGAMLQSYDVYLWVLADQSGVVKRLRIPITVPTDVSLP